jgi:hypothetical protein
MEETICSIEITDEGNLYRAKVQTAKGRYKEYEDEILEDLLERVYEDVSEELL